MGERLNPFLKKALKTYKKPEVETHLGRRSATREDFGRKSATGREIYNAIHPERQGFVSLLETYLPTPLDVQQKTEGRRRRHHSKKPR